MLHKSCVQAQTSSNPLTADTFLAIFEKSSASLFAKFLEAHMGSSPKFCGGPSETPWMKELHYVRISRFFWHFEILNRKTGY